MSWPQAAHATENACLEHVGREPVDKRAHSLEPASQSKT